jgi:hypothetical protein
VRFLEVAEMAFIPFCYGGTVQNFVTAYFGDVLVKLFVCSCEEPD